MKTNFFYNKWICLCSFLCCMGMILNSCKKEDAINTKELIVYAPPGNAAYNVSIVNLALVDNVIFGSYATGFPALLSRHVDRDVQVTAVISYDSTLLRIYDSIYKITIPSSRLPAGVFALANDGMVTIKKNATASQDSIRLQVADVSKIKAGITYIVPVILSTVSNGIPVSSNRQVMYLKVTTFTLLTGISSFSNASQVDINLKKEAGIISGTDKVYLKAFINQTVTAPVTVTVRNNDALIQAYNTKNKTNYKAFPSGAYQLVKKEVVIASGKMEAADSLQIAFPDLSLFKVGEDYLLPVQVADPSAGNPAADPLKNVVYLHVNVFENNIDPSNSGLQGTTVSRTGWSLTVTGTYTGSAANLVDGNINTGWLSAFGLPQGVTIDINNSQTIKGFFIDPYYTYSSLGIDFINMDVFSSADGITWKLEGKYIGTPVSGRPDTKIIKFITPVTARYFKFATTKVTSVNYSITGMSEINAVQ